MDYFKILTLHTFSYFLRTYVSENYIPMLVFFNKNAVLAVAKTAKNSVENESTFSTSNRFGSRSIRRSVRSGSIKLKQTYEHLMENGDIGVNRVTSSRARPHDLDIKLLQAKRQQAEMRR